MKMRYRRKRKLYDPDYCHMKMYVSKGMAKGTKNQVLHTVGQFSVVRKQRIFFMQHERI